jgi:hypothetical protein
MEPFDYFEELSKCQHLFLEELVEPETNTLRIQVIEGRASNIAVPIQVAGQLLGEGYPARIDANAVRYELTWNSYVLYEIVNESFGRQETSEDGILASSASVYKSSSLLDYVFRSTNASDEYPGKLVHFRIVCANHIIDVISTDRPVCRKIGGPRLHVH